MGHFSIFRSIAARKHTYTGSIGNFAFVFTDCICPNIPLSHMEVVVVNSTCTKVSRTKHYERLKQIGYIIHAEILPPLLGNKLFLSIEAFFGAGYFGWLPMVRLRKNSSNLPRLSPPIVPPRLHTAAKRNRHFSNSVTSSSMAPFEVISSISKKESKSKKHKYLSHQPLKKSNSYLLMRQVYRFIRLEAK